MDAGILDIDASITGFFIRNALTSRAKIECFHFIEQLYPDQAASAAPCQGYCSLTVLVGNDLIIQFRPYNYRLDLALTTNAREVYGTFAPKTSYLATLPESGLLVYGMDRISGMPFKDFRASKSQIASSTTHRASLCRDFAAFLARSWSNTCSQGSELGLIGSTIAPRLKALASSLPPRFRPTAKEVLRNLHLIEALPWVLTHGDIVAGNIMVEPLTGRLTGFVDWAEAERLPFGVCLYGLEELLGEQIPSGFQYRNDAATLRATFWDELRMLIPELQEAHTSDAVKMARDLGVLLWHGIAFDDGAINRVVQEGRDMEEIQRLDAFLDVQYDCALFGDSKL